MDNKDRVVFCPALIVEPLQTIGFVKTPHFPAFAKSLKIDLF